MGARSRLHPRRRAAPVLIEVAGPPIGPELLRTVRAIFNHMQDIAAMRSAKSLPGPTLGTRVQPDAQVLDIQQLRIHQALASMPRHRLITSTAGVLPTGSDCDHQAILTLHLACLADLLDT